jgi:hypothetical protein
VVGDEGLDGSLQQAARGLGGGGLLGGGYRGLQPLVISHLEEMRRDLPGVPRVRPDER